MCTYAYPSQLEMMQHQFGSNFGGNLGGNFGSNFSQIFMHKSAMQLHARDMQRSEIKPHQCQQCLKSFSSNHQLVQHIRVHTGEKPYKCSYCDRRFKQLSHVQQHTRLHTGERPYKCHYAECGRAFIQLSNLQQHLRNHDSQLERMKNRPFHCQICGKGFATESSLRTHTTKHAALIGGPNAVNCPLCQKMFLGGAALMEHMKHVHKDPNASGVAAKRRTPNHPCPICGKQYVNEGSLRKHMVTHPEAAGLASPLRMWPCSVCQAVFTHESAFLTHMDHMRMDPKHQFAAQYVLSRAAAEQRERETLFAAAAAAASSQMGMHSHMFPSMSHMGGMGSMSHMGGMSSMGGMGNMSSSLMTSVSAASPSGRSDSSRMSTPAETKLEPRGAGSAAYSAAVLPSSGGVRGDLEQRTIGSGVTIEPIGCHAAVNGGTFYSDRHKMEPANISRLDMLNRLDVGNHSILQGGVDGGATSSNPTRLSSHATQPPRAPGDNMRAMIQQTQAELVRSTLTSQAESARSLGALRNLTTQANNIMANGGGGGGSIGQNDLRMFQADLGARSAQQEMLQSQYTVQQQMAGTENVVGDPFRAPDHLRLGSGDPRAAYGFLQQNSHIN